MAFGATLTITVNSVAKVLNKVNQDSYGSEYMLRTSTEEYRTFIRHRKETNAPANILRGMDRHNVTVRHTIFATATVPEIIREASFTYRNSPGDDLTAIDYFMAGSTGVVYSGTTRTDLLAWTS